MEPQQAVEVVVETGGGWWVEIAGAVTAALVVEALRRWRRWRRRQREARGRA